MQNRMRTALPIIAVVSVSAVLRVAASRSFEAPWIAPDEMIYGLLGRSLWETGQSSLLGQPAPFYGGYPLLVGLPLHLLGVATAVATIQVGQAILMSLAAAAVWAWARPLAGNAWALAAAALTACLPALAYSGLLMSEAAFLPAATLALWLTARTITQPSQGRQAALLGALGLATAARLQGVILVPILVTAVLLAAWFARDRRVFTRLSLTWATLGVLVASWIAFRLVADGGVSGVLGAYSGTLGSGYDARDVAHFVFYHVGDVFLLVLGIPLVALGVLAYGAARGRESNAGVRTLAAVSLAAALWLPLQVGVFASRYVGHLAERDLIVVAPPLFVCLGVWLARGVPRPQPATSIIAFAIAVPAVLLPVRTLVTPFAAPDAFMILPMQHLLEATSARFVEVSWTLFAVLLVVIAVAIPRRAAALVPAMIGIGLIAASALASSEITRLARIDNDRFFGTAGRTWVNDVATEQVTYLYDGSAYWNAAWKTAFWNDRIRRIVRLPGPSVGSLPATIVEPGFDGALVTEQGVKLEGRRILASTAFAFVGEPVAEIAQKDLDQAGLRLWRTPGPPRLSTWITGLKPNGDIVQPIRVVVYSCGPGRLELTLLGKQGTPVLLSVDGTRAALVALASGDVWNGAVPTPKNADGKRVCSFEIRSAGLVGSTKIAFVRAR
ncbi:MAG: glycosyltransferase family 39 protein [Thermoleophilia bacterium]|nr:glycosyltransferase family 39 protein [Thermoleophilia bacterium]